MFIVSQFKLKVFLIFLWKEVELIFSGFIKKPQEVMRENYIPMYYQICILLVYLITLQIFDHQVDDMMRKFFCWSRLLRKSCTYIIHRYLYCKYLYDLTTHFVVLDIQIKFTHFLQSEVVLIIQSFR